MARHLTWCLRRTIVLTNRLSVNRPVMTVLKFSDHAAQPALLPVTSVNHQSIDVDYDDENDYTKFAAEYKHGFNLATMVLMKILDVTKKNAEKAITEHPMLKDLTKKVICKNFQILREAGIYKSTVKDHIFLIANETDTLKEKIKLVHALGVDLNEAVPLFHLSIKMLARFEKRCRLEASYFSHPNRIHYFAEKLNCDIYKICNLLVYNSYMLKIPAPKILSTTEYLLESGMAPEHIWNDFLIYKYNISRIKETVERAKSINIQPLKPWVVRCHDDVWHRAEEKHKLLSMINKVEGSLEALLCDLFKCEREEVDFLLKKRPNILTINLYKLLNMVTLIANMGYGVNDVMRTPPALHASYDTLSSRFAEYKKTGQSLPHLSVFLIPAHFEKALRHAKILAEINKNSKN